MFFEKISNGAFFRMVRASGVMEKTLILAFEVIVQPPNHTFEIALFSILEHFEVYDCLKIL